MDELRQEECLALKRSRLREIIRSAAGQGRVLAAVSGGVDSSLLLWETVQTLGVDRVVAVTASSPTSLQEDIDAAQEFAVRLGVERVLFESGECSDPLFLANSHDRCYVCKRIRYEAMLAMAEKLAPAVVFDGTQADDDPLDRPGMRALNELRIAAPLAQAGIGKKEVRDLLRTAGFPETAEKASQPCLATRIPFGAAITLAALDRVRDGEHFMRALGFTTIRLRDHNPIARIVTDWAGLSLLLQDAALREKTVGRLKDLGYEFVVVDLEEYGRR
jgi:uncharacterized protein